ncbi:uncharacterized protein SPPG_06394 [Spizellomyces punctatus DAOM BR117]|uniref:mannan endo-1,4-beta-mannosidase n=1 Tax=Spizellomyces punctatus (strain DAOM BR117) TaxID=645134 RepID=A0A0L0HCM7_SPIPD|nr:uncharacterized protein SPPG_06394 [Spizellomyces punctatus DAOM BR117]KNC98716.1 hypothetical protein SPPG_06394 [Spizellomyces punctatus DAOM BR117]|eukprot:XP_016606756.1 hypothetical protein SPPG_06394 [Spizellomyces punctatus DAOM BR117]
MTSLNGFVKRTGKTLLDPSTNAPLRFLSFNTPTLHLHDDPQFVVPTEYEQDDLLASIVEMGGRVVRLYSLGVQTPQEDSTAAKHIIKSGSGVALNERVLRGLDSALSVANRRGVRVIIPLIDRWEWWGGVESFVRLVNPTLPPSAFYTDNGIRNQFKSIVQQLVNRVNTVTNITYKDDPTILAWETGNELEVEGKRIPADWTVDIASHIKNLDQNHLVMDGSWKHGWDEQVLRSPNVDIFSNHYYRDVRLSTGEWIGIGALAAVIGVAVIIGAMAACMPRRVGWIKVQEESKQFTKSRYRNRRVITVILALLIILGSAGGLTALILNRISNPQYGAWSASDAETVSSYDKVFITGEYGLASASSLRGVMDNVIQNKPGFAGALLWSLRGHSKDGGFYIHKEMHGYWSYHYPGFPTAPGFGEDESTVVPMVASYAAELAKQTSFTIPPKAIPSPPTLLNTTTPELKWRGVSGSSSYDVERSVGSELWDVVATVVDAKKPGETLFVDQNVQVGRTYMYRVRARNSVGVSNPSNVVNIGL